MLTRNIFQFQIKLIIIIENQMHEFFHIKCFSSSFIRRANQRSGFININWNRKPINHILRIENRNFA